MLVALASVKSSPGATTTALALGVCWPAAQRPVVVECDPAGGDVAMRFGLAAEPGLVSLAAAARRSHDPGLFWRHAQKLPGGLDVVAGPVGAGRARAALDVLAAVPALWRCAGEQAALIADCGRLDPGAPTLTVLRAADVTLLVVRNEIGELAHVAERAEAVADSVGGAAGAGRLGLLLVGERGYPRDEIADAVGLPIAAVLPIDPRGAAALAGRAASGVARLPLLRYAHTLAGHLVGQHGQYGQASASAAPTGAHLRPQPASPAQPAQAPVTDQGARR
jgi:hypothetical protein